MPGPKFGCICVNFCGPALGVDAVPETLLPWYRGPLADAVADLDTPVRRQERWGLQAVLAGIGIDLRMRLTDHRAGSAARSRERW